MFNKVIYKGTEILNVSNDTVVAEALHAGYTAHNSNGAPITGVAKTYEEGYAAGQAAGGGGGASDPAAEAVMALLRKVRHPQTPAESPAGLFIMQDYYPAGGLTPGMAIIPECITHISDNSLDSWLSPNECMPHTGLVLSLPIIPPVASPFWTWSVNGANCPPKAIYVPDGSVEAYKNAASWGEFADLIKPMSELTCSEGEETEITFIVNDGMFTTKQGVTWREYIMSDNSGYFSINDDNYVCMMEMPIHWSGNSSMFVEADEIILPETDGVYHL